jgi:hypothetical protein
VDAIVRERSAQRGEVSRDQDIHHGEAEKKHDLRADAKLMQFIHFSVKEFLNSTLRLEYSLARCKMPIKLKHVENETCPQSFQQVEFRFGMLPKPEPESSASRSASSSYKAKVSVTPRINLFGICCGRRSDVKFPEN